MIFLSDIHKLVEKGEFSIEFVKQDGTIVKGERCICTSFYSDGATLNLKFCDSEQTRTIKRVSIIKWNDEEVVL
jgi:uncharacterized beta-barrel protein YwiB (DUF1934 family)